jgi:ketosteroid isomerase-like protein
MNERAVEAWADAAAIEDLVKRYCDAVTRRDWDAFEALFSESAVLAIGDPVATRFEGARRIREGMGAMVDAQELLVQVSYGTIVDFDGPDRARGRTTIREMVRGEGLAGLVVFGIYTDAFAREARGWRFAERRLQLLYVDETPLLGHVITPSGSSASIKA